MMTQNIPSIPFTPAKYQAFLDEQSALQTERKAVMERLKIAREMGDLSENGAYKYAKFELGRIGRRLRELKFFIENGEPIASTSHSITEFGARVILLEVTPHNPRPRLDLTLVSQYESDPMQGKISLESPLGQAIVGKKMGDICVAQSPAGEKTYRIESIA